MLTCFLFYSYNRGVVTEKHVNFFQYFVNILEMRVSVKIIIASVIFVVIMLIMPYFQVVSICCYSLLNVWFH